MRARSSFGRLSFVGIVVLTILAIGWRIGTFALADVYRSDNPSSALALSSSDAMAMVALAKGQLLDAPSVHDPEAAKVFAARALVAAPLNADAIRLLGLIAEQQGNQPSATALLVTAANRWPYDAEAQVWAATDFLRKGNIEASLYHLDGLMRAHPEIDEEILPAVASMALDQKTLAPLTNVLASSPPWRPRFFQLLATQSPDPMAPMPVLMALKAGSAPPTEDEIRPFLNRLVTASRFEQAYLAWVRFLPAEDLKALGNVRDGRFDGPITGLPFEWTLQNVQGAIFGISNPPGEPDERALKGEFNGGRVPFQNFSQLLLLRPGNYRLTVKAMAEDLQNDRGFTWRVYCATDQRLLGETERVKGSIPWTTLRTEFEVPTDNCPAQLLRLELAARVALEQQVSGTIWFDDVAIDPAENSPTDTNF